MDESWFTDSDVKEFFETIASVSKKDATEPVFEKGMKNVTNKVYEASQIMYTWYAIYSFK